jgi:integrase/recombinase XerD
MRLSVQKAGALWEERGKQEGAKAATIRSRKVAWGVFERYVLQELGQDFDLREFTREHGVSFLVWMNTGKLRPPGAGYGELARRIFVLGVKTVFQLLQEQKLILRNPIEDLDVVKLTRAPNRAVLTEAEVSTFLDSIDEHAELGIRDRSLMELLYSSGLRPSEAGALKVSDVDMKQRLILVRREKVGKVQIIPITHAAAYWLGQQVSGRGGEEYVFGTRAFLPAGINRRFRKWLKLADLNRPGLTVYCLRHSCATHLLNHGADLRYVQHLLGHNSVETTVIYTHEQIEEIRRIYKSFHPRENRMWKEVWGEYEGRLNTLRRELGG